MNPQRVDNYIDSLQPYFLAHNIIQRVVQLEKDFEMRTSDFTPLIHRYEQLDRAITEGMLAAEKACCTSKHGYGWSLKLVPAGKTVCYWKTRKSSICNKTDFEHMYHLAKALEIGNDPSITLSDIDKKLTMARKVLKLVQKTQLRQGILI
eukprot:4547267-Ditylum_brightwellii.AAC.1